MRGLLIATLALIMTGCVAVWGGPSNITHISSDAISYEYDPMLTTINVIQDDAIEHCQYYGHDTAKQMTDTWDLLIGIKQASFVCTDTIEPVTDEALCYVYSKATGDDESADYYTAAFDIDSQIQDAYAFINGMSYKEIMHHYKVCQTEFY